MVTFPDCSGGRCYPVPTLPTTNAQNYPDTTGYTVVGTLDSTCSNWDSLWATAATHATGAIIYMPAGQTCTSATGFTIPAANEGPGGIQPVASVNTSTGVFTVTTTGGHGFVLNSTVYIESDEGAFPTPIGAAPTMYYVVNPTTYTFQLAATLSGTPIIPTSTGAGIWVSPTVVPNQTTIVFRSNAPDSALPPPGVRIDPSYAAAIGVLQTSTTNHSAIHVNPFVHNTHVGPAIEFTHTPNAVVGQFDYPIQGLYGPLWGQGYQTSWNYIALDRVWVHGQGCPSRVEVGLEFDGANVEIDSSLIDSINICRPNYSGLSVTASGSTITGAAGTWYFTGSTSAVSAYSATVSGSVSGTVYVTFPVGGTIPNIYVPSGESVACTGCTGVVSTLSDFPRSAGYLSEGPIASIPLIGGVLGTPTMTVDEVNISFVADSPSGGNAEGGTAIDVVYGPGPQRITNTYFHNNIGIGVVFLEDTGAAQGYTLADFLLQGNTFVIDPSHVPTNGTWDHRNYCERNPIEFKTGMRLQVTGNTITGHFGWCTPDSMGIIFSNNAAFSQTQPPTAAMSDITVTGNTIHDSAGGIGLLGAPGGNMPHIARRALVKNNLLYNINGYNFSGVAPAIPHLTPGWGIYLGYGGESWTIDHNTIAELGG